MKQVATQHADNEQSQHRCENRGYEKVPNHPGMDLIAALRGLDIADNQPRPTDHNTGGPIDQCQVKNIVHTLLF